MIYKETAKTSKKDQVEHQRSARAPEMEPGASKMDALAIPKRPFGDAGAMKYIQIDLFRVSLV